MNTALRILRNCDRLPALLALAILALAPVRLAAQSSQSAQWDASSGGAWSTSANWTPATVPNTPGAIAIFNAATNPGDKAITLAGPVTLGRLLINGQSGDPPLTTLNFTGGLLTFDINDPLDHATLRIENRHAVTISSSFSLASDLDIFLSRPDDGFPSTLALTGPIDATGHALSITTDFPTSIATLSGSLTGAGASLVKNGAGTLRLTGFNNTFDGGLFLNAGRTETALRAAAGASLLIGAVAQDANNLGTGNITLAGNTTLLEIRTSAASQSVNLASGALAITGNALVSIIKNATAHTGGAFNLGATGTLSGDATPAAAGTLRLSGLDFNIASGATILNTPNLHLDSGTGATAATIQTIGGDAGVNIAGLGDITKEGPGVLRIADTVNALSARNLFLRSATLDLGANAGLTLSGTLVLGVTGTGALTQEILARRSGQLDAVAAFSVLAGHQTAFGDTYYNVATLRLDNTTQTLRDLRAGAFATLRIDLGAPGSATTLTLAGASTGAINIFNYEGNPAALANGNAARQDTLLITGGIGGVNPADVWIYGFEKGVTPDGAANEYKPTAFLTGTWLGANAANTDYFDFRNWISGVNAAGMEIPDHPGATADFSKTANSVRANISDRTITLGKLINVPENAGIIDGNASVIIWDSGVTGQPAEVQASSYAYIGPQGTWRLDSDLSLSLGSSYTGKNGLITGSGALILNSGGFNIRGVQNSYTGGTVINGGILGIWTGVANTDQRFLGTGTLTINGGKIFGGDLNNGLSRTITNVTNPLVINGNFTASYLTFAYGGDVELAGARTITVDEAANNIAYQRSVAFSATTNLVGTGTLIKTGNMGALYLLSGSNTFSGGLFVNQGYLYTTVGAGGLVIGESAPGKNYLGSGTVTIASGATLWNAIPNTFAELRGTVVVNNGNLGFYGGTGTLRLQNTGTLIANASGGGLTFQNSITVENNGAALVNWPSMSFSLGLSDTGAITGSPVTGLRSLSKSGAGTLRLGTSVSGSNLWIGGGRLILTQNGNDFKTANLNGGELRLAPNTTNTFDWMTLTGVAGIYMGPDAILTFGILSGTDATNWAPGTQLNLSNDDSQWNDGVTTVNGNYIYITNTNNTAQGQLARIAFSGLAPGAKLVWNSLTSGWYLAPDSTTPINEWTGAATPGFSGTLWSAAGNWAGSGVTGAGDYAAIRNWDTSLENKTIRVDGAFTLGTLEISNNSARFTLTGGTLAFDNNGSAAALNISNGNAPVINTALLLLDDLEFNNLNHYDSYYRTTLNGAITGAGGITYKGYASSANGLQLGTTNATGTSTSDFSGGFRWLGSTATAANASTMPVIRIAADGPLFGTGTLTIGDGTANRWYGLRPGQPGVVDVNGLTRTVDVGALTIAGNIFFGQATTGADTLVLRSTGAGFVATGTWTINGNSGLQNTDTNRNILTLDMPLTGPGGLIIVNNTRVNLLGDNTFTGGVQLAKGSGYQYIGVGSDTAFGTGTLSFTGGGITYLDLLGGNRRLDNDITFSGDRTIVRSGSLTLTAGHSTRLMDTSTTNNGARLTLNAGVVMTIEDGHDITGAGKWWLGDFDTDTGTLVFLGSNSYTGNTLLHSGMTLAVANDHAFGTGTLSFSGGGANARIASHLGSVTLTNQLDFRGVYVTLDGAAGLLTLNPVQTMTLTGNKTITITGGTAAFGQDFSLTGAYGLTKTGAGTLWLMSNASDFTGGVQIAQGALSAVAGAGNITLGKNVAGENYLGAGGNVTFGAGAYDRTLELISTGTVTLAANMNLTGNNDTRRASINVTETSGDVAGATVETYLAPDTAMTIGGNQYGWLNIARDLVMDAPGATVTLASANITTPGEFHVRAGTLVWQDTKVTATNLRLDAAATLELHNVNSPGVQQLTLAAGATLDVMPGTSWLTSATLGLDGDATIDLHGTLDRGAGGVLTLGGAAPAWSGSLLVTNWAGSAAGGGATRLQLTNDALTGAQLEAISFIDVDSSKTYLPGARFTRNYLEYLELLPVGSGATWTGTAGTNEWDDSILENWDISVPNQEDMVALFADLDPLLTGKTVRITQNLTLGGLMLNSNVETYTIAADIGYNLKFKTTVGAAFIQANGPNSVTIDAPVTLENSRLEITNVSTGTLTFGKSITAPSGLAVSKEGSGLVVFNAPNTFSGGFTLNSGSIRIGANGALGANRLTFNDGTLDTGGVDRLLTNDITLGGTLNLIGSATFTGNGVINNANSGFALAAAADTLTATGVLSGTGALTKTGPGTLLLTGVNTFSGGITLDGGITGIDNNAALGTGAAILDTGTLRLDADNLSLINNFTLASTGEINTQTHTGTLSGTISGAGSMTKTGDGTLVLTASNAHTGTTTVAAGAIVATRAAAFGASVLSVESAGSADLAFTGAFTNTVAGAGNITVTPSSSVALGGVNTAFTGTWTIPAAVTITSTQNLGPADVALTGTLIANAGANTLFLSNTLTAAGLLRFAGTGTQGFGAGAPAGFSGMVEAASGRFLWDTYASTALTSATLAATGGLTDIAAGSQTAQTLAIAGGTLAFTGTATVTTLQINAPGAIVFDQGKLTARTILQQDEAVTETLVIANNTFAGDIANLRLVTAAAGATLGTTSTLAIGTGTDALAIYSNTLAQVSTTLQLAYELTELQLQPGKTLTLKDDAATPPGAAELHALISGAGSLEISATNMITLSTSMTYTGTTFTTSGTLKLAAQDAIYTSAALINNAVFDTGANAQHLRALSGTGTTHLNAALTVESGAYAGSFTGANTLEKTTAGTLTLSGSSTHTGTTLVTAGKLIATDAGAFGASVLSVSATAAAELSALTGTVTNTLAGTGTLRITDNASVNYTGDATAWAGITNIDSGRLYANNPFGAAASRLNVTTGGTLSGTGAITGYVRIRDGGVLAPGNSPGKTTITGTLELDNAILEYDLGAHTNPNHLDQTPGGGNTNLNDRTDVTGAVVLLNTSTLNITGAIAKGEYDLIKYTGVLTGGTTNLALGTFNGGTISMLPNANKYLLNTDESGYIKLLYDFGYFTHWDGDAANWDNNVVDGGSGTWYAPSGSANYTPWVSGTDMGAPNGEWLGAPPDAAGFAIFGNTSGTVTVDNTSGPGTIHFSGAQFQTDGYLITGGTLTTGGTGAVILNTDASASATIATTLTGTHAIEKAGAGTLTLTGANTYTGTTLVTTGALVMKNENAILQNTAVYISSTATLQIATGSMTFTNTLTGAGLLHVDLDSATSAFAFASNASGTDFSGTVLFNKSAFTLNNDALASAAVVLGTANTTHVATGTHLIGQRLTVDGATLIFDYETGTQAKGIISSDRFTATSGTVVVTNTNPASSTTGLFAKPLLQQDEGQSVRLLETDYPSATGTNLTLAGGATITAAILDALLSGTTATATYAQSLAYDNGLTVAYTLTELALISSQTTTLTDDAATPVGAADMKALISGAGSLEIAATNTITLSHANTYTGTTTVTTGTLISGADNALGATSRLVVDSAAAYDLRTYTQTIGSGSIAGALLGSGSLGLDGYVDITSVNPTFTANVGITGTTTLASTQALGNSGTATVAGNAALRIAASGAFAKTLAGAGVFTLENSASVALTAANAAFTGTFDIAAATALSATSTANLGAAAIANDGLFTLANTAAETLANALTGSGTFIKDAAGNLTINHANAFTGETAVNAGTLTLQNLGGAGSGTIANNATLALTGTGAFTNAISSAANTAVNLVTGSVSLRGDNTAFTGTLHVTNAGIADITNNNQIGGGTANVVIAPAGKLTTTAPTFTHALTGAGLLAVETSSSTFAFTAPAGNAFTGTVSLADTTMHLGLSNTNAWALANATLHLLAGSTLATNAETRRIAGLNMDAGSVTLIDMTAVLPAEVLRTGTLSVDSAAKVAFAGYTGTPIASPTNPVNFLDQDDITDNATLLIATDNLKTPGVHVAIVKTDGTPLAPGQQIDYGAAIATYDYTGVTGTATGTTTTHGAAAGLYYDYLLTTLNIKSGSTLILDSTTATDNYKNLAALITGSGNLELIAGMDHITLSHSNSYTGTTTLTSGTAIAGATDALGQTAYLTVTDSAALNLAGHTQTIRDGGTIEGNLFDTGATTGSLGLGGLVTITSTNAAFDADVGVTGTTTLNNTQALGDTGTLDVTGLVTLNNATGTLAKTIAGTGSVALINTSTVALTGANTLQGEWRITDATALHATSTANLGTADIVDNGLFTLANAADETLANALTGTGAFIKDAAGNLTISHTNAFTGKTTITAGALTLADLGGVGTNTITNNANLVLSGAGEFINDISSTANTAVTLVTGSVSLRGDNTAFTGTLAITGTADITTNNQIGANVANVIIATAGKLTTTATTFTHALSGDGVLYASTGASFTFEGANVGTLFTGTVTLASTAMRLTEGVNTSVLANATLQLDAASALHTDSVTGKLHALTLNGGALWLPMNGVDPVEILNVGTLSIAALSSTVVFENYTSATVAPANVVKNFLDQDNLTDNATLLVAADSLAESAPRQIAIKKPDGNALSDGQIIDYGNVEATYNYAALTATATTGATPETGLYYDYVLTQLNVKDGQTLLLTDAGATDDTLSASITGPGSVTYATGSLIALSGANTYTGASTIASGTVRADADNALGATSHLILDAATALDLTTRAQTANVITTASTSTLNLNSGTLTIQSGGQIDGHITGGDTATLTLATGTLHITTANTDYAAATTIAAPATARLTDPAALGAAAIHLDGLLHIDNAATGQMQNTLTGAGEFRKTNTGTLTLTTSNPAYNGAATITAGRVIATQIDTLGTAPIAIAAGATFEQTNINGTLQNPLDGPGTHHVTNSTLAIANAAAYTIANTTLNQTAALILATNGIHFGTLTMNNGALEFMNPTDDATITTLGNTPGLFVMHANLANRTANHLDIANAGSATHAIYIRDNNTAPTAQNFAIPVITTATPGGATFTMANPGGKLEYDLTTIELVRGDNSPYTPNPNAWYLSDRNLSHAADAIINTASTLPLDWANALDSLHQRLADLRTSTSPSTSTLNSDATATGDAADGAGSGAVWLRARSYRLNAGNALSGMSFKQYGWGLTGGADKTFAAETGVNLIGGFIDMGTVDRQFDNAGNGKTRNIGIGAYATLLKTNGWFVDATARHDRYTNDFEAKAVDGRMTRGKYTAKSQSLSVEAGRRLQRTDGWWLEPGVQMAVLWLNGSTYTTQATPGQRAINVRVGDSETYQYRALIRAGRQFRDSRWHPYAKAAIVTVDSSGGEITAHGKTFQTDYDGKRFEFGFGATYRLTAISQLYMDYEYARSASYERPWSLTLGYRKLW